MDTYHTSVNATPIPKKLDNANPAARRWPAFEDSLLEVNAALKYHFMEVWTSSLNFASESFRKKDWQNDTLSLPALCLGHPARKCWYEPLMGRKTTGGPKVEQRVRECPSAERLNLK